MFRTHGNCDVKLERGKTTIASTNSKANFFEMHDANGWKVITPVYINPMRIYPPWKNLIRKNQILMSTSERDSDKRCVGGKETTSYCSTPASPHLVRGLVHIWLGFFGVVVLTMNTSGELNCLEFLRAIFLIQHWQCPCSHASCVGCPKWNSIATSCLFRLKL